MKRIRAALLIAILIIASISVPIFALAELNNQPQATKSDLVKIGENLEINQWMIVGSAVVIGGNARVAGKIEKDLVAVGGTIDIEDSALILGDVVSVGGTINKAPGAIIKGKVVEVNVPMVSPIIISGAKFQQTVLPFIFGMAIVKLIAMIALSWILVAFFTPQLGLISAVSEAKPWRMLGWGFIGIICTFLLCLLLAITIIGIIFIPLLVLAFMIAMTAGYLAVCQLVGKRAYQLFKKFNRPMTHEVTLGLILIWIIFWIPVVGMLVNMAVGLIGFGAVIKTRFGTKSA